MKDLVLLGTDTDAGKTTAALLWLHLFADSYEYWKPIETGPSDTGRIRDMLPDAATHAPLLHLNEAVAPSLAARHAGLTIPTSDQIVAGRPAPIAERALLIETFGGPFSPLNAEELQIALLRRLPASFLLIVSSALGAIGRAIQCLTSLETERICPTAVILLGMNDPFAEEQIRHFRPETPVFSFDVPASWTRAGIAACAAGQRAKWHEVQQVVQSEQSHQVADWLGRDERSVWHPYTSLKDPDPFLVCTDAQDEFLTLADGRRIIDGISSWWTILHGHNPGFLRQALSQARLDHVHFAGVTHPPAVALAELILQTVPWKGGRVFFSDNGSTAVEAALKMAYQFWCHHGEPGRTRFVGFEHGYHGDTFGAMSVSRDPVFFGRFEPLFFDADIIPLDPERLDETLRHAPGRHAAVIVEPLVQGAGGMVMHAPETLQQLYEVARANNVLFIADEVMTGGGRTGTLWAHQQANIAPDLICAAKTLTGGLMPLAATIAAPHIVAAWQTEDRSKTFFHGHSFTGHPLACAVAVASWKKLMGSMASRLVVAPSSRMESFWRDALRDVHKSKLVKDVRVKGSIAAVEIDVPGGYLADVGRQLRRLCLDKGVLLRPLGNVLYAMPPYCTSDSSLAQVADTIRYATRSL